MKKQILFFVPLSKKLVQILQKRKSFLSKKLKKFKND